MTQPTRPEEVHDMIPDMIARQAKAIGAGLTSAAAWVTGLGLEDGTLERLTPLQWAGAAGAGLTAYAVTWSLANRNA